MNPCCSRCGIEEFEPFFCPRFLWTRICASEKIGVDALLCADCCLVVLKRLGIKPCLTDVTDSVMADHRASALHSPQAT